MATASINTMKANYRRAFGAALRAAREAAGVNQGEIAAECGVKQTSVSHWESGKTSPSEANLAGLDRLGLLASIEEKVASVTASAPKSNTLTIRLNSDLRERMDRAAKAGPYPISLTAIVERGIILATEEIERMHARLKDGGEP